MSFSIYLPVSDTNPLPVVLDATSSPSIAGATITGLTASKVVVTDASKALASGTETGTGSYVRATSPTLVTPILGTATATDVLIGTSGPSVKSSLSTRMSRQGLVFDGTAGATISRTLGTSFTIAFWANPSVISGNRGVVAANGTAAGNITSTDGLVKIYNGAGYKNATGALLEIGKDALWAYTLSGGTGTWYKNGVQVIQAADAGTYPDTLTLYGRDINGDNWTGTLGRLLIYNRAFTAAEVLSLYESGAPAGADYPTIAAGAANTLGDWTNGSTAFDTWTATGGTQIIAASAGIATGGSAITAVPVGKRVRVTYTMTYTSGAPVMYLAADKDQTQASALSNVVTLSTTNGTYTAELTSTSNSADTVVISQPTAAASSFTLASTSCVSVGLLLAPDPLQPGYYQWHDQSGNGANILLPSSGVTWALPSSQPTKLRGATVHSGSGNIQLHGAACIPTNHHITQIRAKASTGTPTVYIGNASGDNSYVTAVALSTSWKVLTVVTATSITTTTAIWVNSDGAATISLDISHEPVTT